MAEDDLPRTAPALPPSAALLQARHIAHDRELRRLVEGAPIREGARVVDVACGDGFFTEALGERVGSGGLVAAVDVDRAVFQRGRAHRALLGPERRAHFYQADAAALPFAENTFDAAWCAHSLISIPDPQAALCEMRRVVRPDGLVALVENDVLHDVILPWPAELELAVGRAEEEAYRNRHRSPRRLHIARRLGEMVHGAGLELIRRTTYPVDRRAPLNPNDERFVTLYLQGIWQRVNGYLSAGHRHELQGLVDPGSSTAAGSCLSAAVPSKP